MFMKKFIAILTATVIVATLFVSVSAKSVKMGDVNSDNKVNASDARLILRFAARLDTATKEQSVVADVDSNNKINATDARIVLRVAAKLHEDLGEIIVGNDVQESTTADNSQTIELKDYIGMPVKKFTSQYTGMIKDGTSDGSTMYHNSDVVIVSDPKMIDDLKINSITVTGKKYSLNGIVVDMTSSFVSSKLIADGWKLKTENEGTVVYSKQSDLMKIAVKNGVVTQVELCLAVSIATETTTDKNVNNEPTTQEPTTEAPTVQETTTQETTTAPIDDKNYVQVSDLPENVRTFLSGKFGFKGAIYGTDSDGNPSVTPIQIYSDGNNYNVGMNMSDVYIEILIISDGKDGHDLYMANKTNNKCHKLSDLEQKIYGINADSLVSSFNVGDTSNVKIYTENIVENGAEYFVYTSTNGVNITRLYTVDGEMVKITNVDSTGKQLSRIDITEFYITFSADVFDYSQYKNVLTILEILT